MSPEGALAEINRLEAERIKITKRLHANTRAKRWAMGCYLVATGWRLANDGWVRPERPLHTGPYYGTYAAFSCQRSDDYDPESLST